MRLNPVSFFEIPVANLERAKRFYEATFEVVLELVEIDGNLMALFPFEDGAPGASGALAKGDSYVPGKAGARVYFSVDDIAGVLIRAQALGATVNYPVTEVPGFGWVAELIDLEGNILALHTQQPPARSSA